MPPKKGKKKKSGKKGKKSGKSSGKTTSVEPSEEQKLSNEGKNNFLIQVKDLEKQIDHYQRRCDDLEIINSLYDSKFQQLQIDKEDISDYLQKSLNIRTDEIMKLKFEFEELQQLKEKEKETYEEQIAQKQKELEETKEQLESDKRIKSGQLASMEEFKIEKEGLMRKFDAIREEIRELEETNREDIYQKEKAAVIDLDRLKKETITRGNDVATEFRKVSNRQMAETNKKTIRENVELSNQLKRKSNEIMKLLMENDRLRNIFEKEQKLEIEVSETVVKELQKKSEKNMKAIKSWVEECRNSEAEIMEYESDEHRENAVRIQLKNKDLTSQQESIRSDLADLEDDHKSKIQFKDNLLKEIANSKGILKTYRRLINRTKDALIDVENTSDPSEEFTEAEILLRRQRMMDSLLRLMNAASTLGFGIVPAELGKQTKIK